MELAPITKDKNKKPILAVKRPPDTQSARSSVSSIADGSFQRKSQSFAYDVQGGALVSSLVFKIKLKTNDYRPFVTDLNNSGSWVSRSRFQ